MNHPPVSYVNHKGHTVVFYRDSEKLSLRTKGKFPMMFENLEAFRQYLGRCDLRTKVSKHYAELHK